MEFSQVRYFLKLAETLNFTSAARLAGVSQPSLTRSIRRLEEELGAPLIYRDGKDTRLTALGRDMQMEFLQIEKLVANAHDLADNSIAGERRRLVIGVAPTITPKSFSLFLANVFDQLPSVEIEMQQMKPDEGSDAVLSGTYDLCLLPSPPAENVKLMTLRLYEEQLSFAVAKDHPLAKMNSIAPEQIARETYLDRLACEFRSQLIQHFMDQNIVMRARFQSEREDWVQQLVADGVGICALPERSAIVSGLSLKQVEGMNLARTITLVAVSGGGNPREIKQIFDLARSFEW